MNRFFNRAIRILLVTNSLILIASAMIGPIYALFVEKIGGDLLDASYAFGLFALVAGLVTLVSGRYSDRLKEPELIVVAGYMIMGLGFLGYLLVNSIWTLLIIQVIIGLGGAVYSPAFDAVYSQHLDGHKSGREWGAWEALNYFSTAAGAVLGGLIAVQFGFNVLFVVMALFCFISGIYIYFLPRRVL